MSMNDIVVNISSMIPGTYMGDGKIQKIGKLTVNMVIYSKRKIENQSYHYDKYDHQIISYQ